MFIIVGTVIKKQDKYLMVKEARKDIYDMWSLPAGHFENGETLEEGALRETREETGCDVKLIGVLPSIEGQTKGEQFLRITYLAEVLNEEEIVLKQEILDKKWMTFHEIKNIPKEKFRFQKLNLQLLESVEKGEVYPLDIIKVFN